MRTLLHYRATSPKTHRLSERRRNKVLFIFTTVLILLGGIAPSLIMPAEASTTLQSGSLLRCGSKNIIYYLGADGDRHAFPDAVTYLTWFKNYNGIKRLKQKVCDAQFPIGSAITVRPGAVVKFSYSPKVYAVEEGAILRPIDSVEIARLIYPSANRQQPDSGWQKILRVLSPQRRADYTIGDSVVVVDDQVDFSLEDSLAITIDSLFSAEGSEVMFPQPASPAPGATPTNPPVAPVATPAPTPVAIVPVPTPTPLSVPTPTFTPTPTPALSPVGTASVGVADARLVLAALSFALPAYNQRVTEPVFGTAIRRITDRVAAGGFGAHLYSQLQAFSSDDAYVLLNEDGDYVVRRVDTLARAKDAGLANINAPRWQPALPHTLVFYDTNEDTTIRVQYGNMDTGAVDTIFTFPSNYQRIRGNQSFDELSHDGAWMAGMAALANGDQMIFTLNLETKTLGAQISLNSLYNGTCAKDPVYGAVEPDWIAPSPLGKYLVVQWKRDGVTRCSGLETFSIQTGQYVGRVYDSHQHGDLGVDKDGVTEYFMSFELTHPADSNRPGQGLRVLPGPATGVQQPKYLQLMDWGNQSHISCQGPDGVCLITSGSDASNGYNPFEGEVWLQYADGRVLRLAHHRSSECGYWVQPRASFSRDGRYVIFDSDWGVNRCAASNENLGRGETYLIELSSGLASRGPSPPSSPVIAPSAGASAAPLPASPLPLPLPIQSSPPTTTSIPQPPPPTSGSASAALGSIGPLPPSTYTLQPGETFTLADAAAPATVYADPRMGAGTCFATDFIIYELYAAVDSSNRYQLIGTHRGADRGQWLAGNSVDTGGCAKDRVIYTLKLGSGAHTVALCITNAQNTSQRICKTIQVTQ